MTRKRTTENDLLASAASAPARRKPAARTPRSRRTASPVEASPAPAVEPAAPASEAVVATVVPEPSYEEIATLAYSYWEARGCQGGSHEEDWLRAEQELRSRASAATA
jgi:hypothetical protein